MGVYEIYSYGNVDALSGLFNIIAAVMGSNTFMTAVALVFVVGFLAALGASVFAQDRLHGTKWLASVVLINALMFLPTGTVQVVDKVGTAPPQVIANVPLGLVVQASLVSSVGDTLTDLFETATQVLSVGGMDANLTYQGHGIMFGAKLIRNTMLSSLGEADPVLHGDLINFIQNCTTYDISQGLINANTFANSTNVWPLMANTNQARFTPIAQGGTIVPMACPDAYNDIDGRLQNAVQFLETKLGLRVNPYLQQLLSVGSPLSGPAALAIVDPQITSAFANINQAGLSAAQLVQHNAMLNAFQDANTMGAQSSNDPSAMMLGLGTAQARAQSNASFLSAGKLAEEALPLIRNVLEATLYGIFPFVLLMSMVVGGRSAFNMLKGYSFGLIWISLWPPIYAIINYFGTLYSQKHAAANAFMNGVGGMALSTASPIYGDTISDMAVVGYIITSVPVIAGAIVFGLHQMTGLATGMIGGISQATNAPAHEAATGNVSMGQVSLSNQWQNRTESGLFTGGMGGLSSYDYMAGSNMVHFGTSTELSNRYSTASSKMESLAQEEAKAREQTITQTYQQAQSHIVGTSQGTQNGQGGTISSTISKGTDLNKTSGTTHQTATEKNASDTSVSSSKVGVTADASLGLRVAGTGGGVTVSAGGEQSNANTITANNSDRNAAHQAQTVSEKEAALRNWVKSEDFRNYKQTHTDDAAKIENSLTKSDNLRNSSSLHHRQAEEYRQTAERIQSSSVRGDVNWDKQFNQYLAANGVLAPDKPALSADETMAWGNRFFKEAGLAATIDDPSGSQTLLTHDGHGPAQITKTPVVPPNLAERFASQSAPDVQKPELPAGTRQTAAGSAPSALIAPEQKATEQQIENATAAFQKNERAAASAVDGSTGDVDNKFKEAAKNADWTHNLGYQPNERDAYSQLKEQVKNKTH